MRSHNSKKKRKNKTHNCTSQTHPFNYLRFTIQNQPKINPQTQRETNNRQQNTTNKQKKADNKNKKRTVSSSSSPRLIWAWITRFRCSPAETPTPSEAEKNRTGAIVIAAGGGRGSLHGEIKLEEIRERQRGTTLHLELTVGEERPESPSRARRGAPEKKRDEYIWA